MKKFITSTLASLALLTPTAALAEINNYEDHIKLFEALQTVGVTININSKIHCDLKSSGGGSYHKNAVLLTICQNNGVPGGEQVEWTTNDLDTLRHEAHHVVQDWAAGGIGDGKFVNLFDDEESFVEFLTKSSFTPNQIRNLIFTLVEQGLDSDDIYIEVEAYVVANDIDAGSIANKVLEFCS